MPFVDFEDVVQNIVDEVFLDKQREDGVYDYESLPKNFLKLALVSHNFADPVRRNLYRDLRVEGTERFLLLTGQLRFSPHLAKFVKSADLVSNCLQRTPIDPGFDNDSDDDHPGYQPRSVSVTALRWFLEACPQLTSLSLTGGDFMWALCKQDPKTLRITDVTLLGCSRCNPRAPTSCTADIHEGWLKRIVAFPRLKELDISEFDIGAGPVDATVGVKSGSSVCTGLSISNMNKRTTAKGLTTLIRSMPGLKELVLDGLQPMPRGELKKCLQVAARLTLLTITDYHSEEGFPRLWEDDTVAGLQQLKTLSLNGVPVLPPFLDALPPRLEHLRLSRLAVALLPVPVLVAWLRSRFSHRGVLKKFEVVGELRGNSFNKGPKASDAQVAELAQLCSGLNVEFIHNPNEYGF
ncbi:hypothetical protein C8F04DRAFT_1047389 [Mycena alexandri]|uniref:Uncharacterized protein n=1 Tax=Mycena alexandri TaxID=1745969 RepID=A0AAD6WT16_9AGAR|nr:hypothetical protein C8F04DRAFT_1047389 [Mycena alexandri]